MFVSDIQARVAHAMGVPVEAMREPDGSQGQRKPERVEARWVAMALSLDLTRHGPSKVGRLFGNRDHSTVLHAKAQVELRRATDEQFDEQMRDMARALEAA